MHRDILTAGGLTTALAALGDGAARVLDAEPAAGMLIGGCFGLLGILIRCAFEFWKITRRDRERLRDYRRKLERAGIDPDDTED